MFVCWLVIPLSPSVAADGVERVRARGYLTCGLPDRRPGFAVFGADGKAAGFDADFCRALAAAILGAADKVKFVQVDTAREFLGRPEIDVVFHGLTWTFTRELTSGLSFGPVTFHDGQAFLVRKDSAASNISQLVRPAICVEARTNFSATLATFVRERGLDVRLVQAENAATAQEVFFRGQCDALSADASTLISATAGQNAEQYRLLPELISKEPLAPVVRRDDDRLRDVLRWTIYVTIAAEEVGLTSNNVDDMASPAWLDPPVADALGLERSFARRVVKQVGNYGEIFARNLTGSGRPTMERGLNNLWSAGGLLYAPPFR